MDNRETTPSFMKKQFPTPLVSIHNGVIPYQINAKYRRPPQIFVFIIPFMKLLYNVDFEPHMLCGS